MLEYLTEIPGSIRIVAIFVAFAVTFLFAERALTWVWRGTKLGWRGLKFGYSTVKWVGRNTVGRLFRRKMKPIEIGEVKITDESPFTWQEFKRDLERIDGGDSLEKLLEKYDGKVPRKPRGSTEIENKMRHDGEVEKPLLHIKMDVVNKMPRSAYDKLHREIEDLTGRKVLLTPGDVDVREIG